MKLITRILSRVMQGGLKQEDYTHLIKGIYHSLLIQGISVILVFAGNFFVVKVFAASQYGTYVHIFNWISILTILALGGQDDVILSRIPKYKEADGSQIAAVVKQAHMRVMITGVLVSLVFLSIIWFIPVKTLNEYKNLFLVAIPAIYLSAFLSLNQTILQALNHVRSSQVIEKLLKPFLLMLLVGLAVLLHKTGNARQLVWLNVLNLVICGLVLSWIVIKKTRTWLSAPAQPYKGKSISGQALYFFVISLLQLLAGKIGMLIMPWFTAEDEIGIFNISYRFADLVIYPYFLLHSVLPQLFARYHSNGLAHNQDLYNKSTQLALITSLPLLIINIVAGRFMLGYFGPEFTSGYMALIVISLSNFLSGVFGPANTVLMMQGREKYAALSFLIYMVFLLVLNVLLIPRWGMTGAAVAIFGGGLMYQLAASWFVWKFTGVVAPAFRLVAKGNRENNR